MFNYFSKGKIANLYHNQYGEESWVSVGYESYPFKKLPVKVQEFIKNEQTQRNLENLSATLDNIIVRIDEVENYLTKIGLKLDEIATNQQMMLVSKEELALKLTDERTETRRLGESIAEIKRAMGVF